MDALDHRTPSFVAVQDAYERWSEECVDLFGSAAKASAEDRAVMTAWSGTVVGPVLDAGCGPGHWSAFLTALGLQVQGVDATAAFVRQATRAHPGNPFRLGDIRTLPVTPGSLGGILAWFSLIHLDPSEVPEVLRRFSSALRPRGTLLLGFFSGARLAPFDHRVVTAWTWPVDRMAHLVESAGLEVLTRAEHPQTSGRVFAELIARRPA